MGAVVVGGTRVISITQRGVCSSSLLMGNSGVSRVNIKVASSSSRIVSTTNTCLVPKLVGTRIRVRDSRLLPSCFNRLILRGNAATTVYSPRRVIGMTNRSNLSFVLRSNGESPYSLFFVLPSYIPSASVRATKTALATTSATHVFSHCPRLLNLNRVVGIPNMLFGSRRIRNGLSTTGGHNGVVSNRCPLNDKRALGRCYHSKVASSRRSVSRRRTLRGITTKVAIFVHRNNSTGGLRTLVKTIGGSGCGSFTFYASSASTSCLARGNSVVFTLHGTMSLKLSPLLTVTLTALGPTRRCGLSDHNRVGRGCLTSLLLISGLGSFAVGDIVGNNGLCAASPTSAAPPSTPASVARSIGLGGPFGLSFPGPPPATRGTHIVNVLPARVVARGARIPVARLGDGRVTCTTIMDHCKGNGVSCNCIGKASLGRNTITRSVNRSDRGVAIVNGAVSSVRATIGRVRGVRNKITIMVGNGTATALPLPCTKLLSSRGTRGATGTRSRLVLTVHTANVSLPSPMVAVTFVSLPIVPTLGLASVKLISMGTFRFASLCV